MKKYILIIIFIALASGIVASGMWYSGRISAESQTAIVAQGVAAEQAQSQNMQKLAINDVVAGTGAEAKSGDTVTVNYIGTLDDGTKFDSSYDRKTPFKFLLGAGQVIKGWDMGVVGMKVGGKRELVIPPEMGYGDRAVSVIPANSTLHFTVELLAVSANSAL